MDDENDTTDSNGGAGDETFGNAPTTPLNPAVPPTGPHTSAETQSQPSTQPPERPSGPPMSYSERPEQVRHDVPPAGAPHTELPPHPSYPQYPQYPPSTPGYQAYPAQTQYPAPRAQPSSERRTPAWIKVTAGCLIAFAVVIAFCAVASGVIGGLAIASATVSGSQSQTLNVTGTPHVVLDVQAGNVHVMTGQSATVGISLTKSARALSSRLARQMLDDMRFTATQSDDTITITTDYGSIDQHWPVFSRRLDLTVTVPQTTNLSATMQAGNLTVDGTNGTLDLTSRAGNVELNEVTLAGDSSLRLTAGNVTLHGTLADHAALDVDMTAGNVTLFLPASTPARLDATVTAGHASAIGFPAGNTSSGSALGVDLNPNPTSTITIRVTAGNASVMAE